MASCKTPVGGMGNFVGKCGGSNHASPLLISGCRAAASTLLSVVYDLPSISSTNDPTVVKINTFADTAGDYGFPGNYLVEFLTWMKYIPSSLAKWKRVAEERHKEYSDMFVGMYREVEDRIVTWFCLLHSAP